MIYKLLGFDAGVQAAKWRAEIGIGMFDKPNAKAMQIVLHFLLMNIKKCTTSEQHNASPEWKDITNVFHHSYPCVDRVQARDFLACCVGALVGFEKGPAAVFPPGTIRKSHFAAPQGDRLYTIFWHLSTYALQLTLSTQYPTYPVPSVQLTPPTDSSQFPHLINTLKAHVRRQSALYLTRLASMEAAEDSWRDTAATLTAQFQSLQAQLAEFNAPAAPRVPGQMDTEAENDKSLFSAAATAEREHRLHSVKEGQRQLQQMFQRTQQQRDTLNNVLNGVWQPTTLDRAHLERILSGSRQPTAGARANSQPINLAHVVTEWNDGLLKMQSVLAQYVQPGPDNAPTAYVTGLTETRSTLESHLKEHHLTLSSLRAVAHGLRTSLLPELEAELGKLQQQLREAGSYSGPVFQAPPPALIPPTPARANHAPSLAVPPTPAFAPPRSTVAQTPAHAPQRMPSKISDSVRRAVHSKNARQAHQRDYLLSTIVDEEHHPSPAGSVVSARPSSATTRTHQYQPQQFDIDDEKFTLITSPLSQHGSEGSAISPQFPKKLVFSPEGVSSRTSHASTPSSTSRFQLSAPSRPSVSYSTRSSLSPTADISTIAAPSASAINTAAASGRLTSPPPSNTRATPPAHHATRTPAQSRGADRKPSFLSPATNLAEQDGLLGADELYLHDQWDPAGLNDTLPEGSSEAVDRYNPAAYDDDDDDEVVFSVGDGTRRISAASSTVDPDAPTPAPARRTDQRYHRTTPMSNKSVASTTSVRSNRIMMSPSYDFGAANAGLLDE